MSERFTLSVRVWVPAAASIAALAFGLGWLAADGGSGADVGPPVDAAVAGAERVRRSLTPEVAAAGSPVEVSFERVAFDPPLVLATIERADWDRSTPQDAYRGLYSANLAGDMDWVMAAFEPEARVGLALKYEDPAWQQRYRRHFGRLRGERIEEIFFYGDYAVLLLEQDLEGQAGGRRRQVQTRAALRRHADGWYATDALERDPVWVHLAEVLRTRR